MSSTPSGISARDLRKSYPAGRGAPRIAALDGLSIEVEAGTIFGLLGPNGAGKSTTVKILSTLSRAESGTAQVAGIDVARHPERVRRVIGFVAQKSVAEVLRTIADGPGNVLVHCAAGKDRTGWTIATLLTAIDADRDAVLADYLLSNAAIESLREWMRVQYGDEFDDDREILGVDPSYLQAAFDSADRNFGSFTGYLDAIGVDADVRERLCHRLVG